MSGTVAVISPMGTLRYLGEEYVINHREVGALQKIYDTITGIQTGKGPGYPRLDTARRLK
ncbi:MAG: hypothetical protein R2912_02305 [Eubacteriales bacterium]